MNDLLNFATQYFPQYDFNEFQQKLFEEYLNYNDSYNFEKSLTFVCPRRSGITTVLVIIKIYEDYFSGRRVHIHPATRHSFYETFFLDVLKSSKIPYDMCEKIKDIFFKSCSDFQFNHINEKDIIVFDNYKYLNDELSGRYNSNKKIFVSNVDNFVYYDNMKIMKGE